MGKQSPFCKCRFDRETGKRIRCEMHKQVINQYKRPRYSSLPPQVIYDYGQSIKDSLGRALFYFLYLTGCRINEATQFKPMHLTITDRFYRIKMTVLKKRRIEQSERIAIIPRGERAKCYENEMMRDVIAFIKGKAPDAMIFRKWGNMSVYLARCLTITLEAKRKRADGNWVMDSSYTKKLHPHLLRHFRSTHLAQVYGFSDTKLRIFYNWADSKVAVTYTGGVDLEDSF